MRTLPLVLLLHACTCEVRREGTPPASVATPSAPSAPRAPCDLPEPPVPPTPVGYPLERGEICASVSDLRALEAWASESAAWRAKVAECLERP